MQGKEFEDIPLLGPWALAIGPWVVWPMAPYTVAAKGRGNLPPPTLVCTLTKDTRMRCRPQAPGRGGGDGTDSEQSSSGGAVWAQAQRGEYEAQRRYDELSRFYVVSQPL